LKLVRIFGEFGRTRVKNDQYFSIYSRKILRTDYGKTRIFTQGAPVFDYTDLVIL